MGDEISQAIALLNQIIEDRTVPRNIRDSAKKAADYLGKDEDITVKVDKAIQVLDEVSEDPNVPMYTRTQIWSIVSLLESADK
jgi:uncharacterized protein (UPF0147 family)